MTREVSIKTNLIDHQKYDEGLGYHENNIRYGEMLSEDDKALAGFHQNEFSQVQVLGNRDGTN